MTPAAKSRRGRPTRVLLYGATGYTGALIARAASARDLPLVLAGRDGGRLQQAGQDLGYPVRLASLDDGRALREALSDVGLVVNAAGPFTSTARPLVEACVEAGIHYVDVSGEVDAIDDVAGYDGGAREAGVMLMPGAGFDVVASDCLVARVKRRLPQANHLMIGIAGLDLASRGSARTILQQLGRGVRVRRGGQLVSLPEGVLEAHFDFGEGGRACACVSWGDVVTAFHTTGIPNIEVYFESTLPVRAFQLLGQSLIVPPVALMSRMWLGAWAEAQSDGPTEAERATRRATIVARADAPDGRTAVSRARTPEVYTFTALAAAAVAARVRAGEFQPGFQTPARIFGEDFVRSFDGVSVEDVRTS